MFYNADPSKIPRESSKRQWYIKSIQRVKEQLKWPVPTTRKEVESYLGYVNYHRDHIKDFAEVAEPLYRLTCQNAYFFSEQKKGTRIFRPKRSSY